MAVAFWAYVFPSSGSVMSVKHLRQEEKGEPIHMKEWLMGL